MEDKPNIHRIECECRPDGYIARFVNADGVRKELRFWDIGSILNVRQQLRLIKDIKTTFIISQIKYDLLNHLIEKK